MGTTSKLPESNSTDQGPEEPLVKPWGMSAKYIYVLKENLESLYEASQFLSKDTRGQLGLTMRIPVFIQDPLVAQGNPKLGIQEIEIRLEAGLGDGPTSARIAVVDYDGDHQALLQPVKYDAASGWFRTPENEWLPDVPEFPKKLKDKDEQAIEDARYKEAWKQFIDNPYFHQVNVWAVVQRVLEFYESSRALGRPVPWGFDGNRLLVVPHAGYGENAYYDQSTKSLQFYYYGDEAEPRYTCLSHDIIAHESGHAVLDGIRPLYNENPSLETAAFHEFIGDLTAILLALDNKDIRDQLHVEELDEDNFLSSIAEEFGREVEDRPYLRSATNKLTMKDPELKDSLSAHMISQVLTGAMFDILVGIAQKLLEAPGKENTAKEALWKATEKFRRVALQPLDLCPPCDIQFIDYARAVIRNDILTNPVDAEGYRQVMLQVFHDRKLCSCKYKSDGSPLEPDCEFREAIIQPKLEDLVHHDIGRVSRSTTAAYYFLHDNRRVLQIPSHQDIIIAGLYDNAKLGALAERLPRQDVIQYIWKEQLIFEGESYGKLEGKKVEMYCGGTLVFDDRGNLLSWFRKPGSQLLSNEQEEIIRKKIEITELQEALLLDKRQEEIIRKKKELAKLRRLLGEQQEEAISKKIELIKLELQELRDEQQEEATRKKIKLTNLQQAQRLDEQQEEAIRKKIESIKLELAQLLGEQQEEAMSKRTRPTKLELAQLADMKVGRTRKQATLNLYSRWWRSKRISLLDESSRGMPRELLRPLTAVEDNGVLHFTTTPHLRKEDRDLEASAWKTNF